MRIDVVLGPEGNLKSFRSRGHAGESKGGGNVACAAVTILLRTAARLLAGTPGMAADGDAGHPGEMDVRITPRAAGGEWLKGVTDFLLRGLSDLAREYPGEIDVRVRT